MIDEPPVPAADEPVAPPTIAQEVVAMPDACAIFVLFGLAYRHPEEFRSELQWWRDAQARKGKPTER